MRKDSGHVASASRKAYVAPVLTVFGSLRELTLSQDTVEMPADNQGKGVGGKIISD
ncbi:MAG: lasso RiPP family leader peptide-containing protein [Vicinamibacterales bacterium]